MISLEDQGIKMQLTLEELGPFVDRLSRSALLRLVMSLAAQIRHLETEVEKTGRQDSM